MTIRLVMLVALAALLAPGCDEEAGSDTVAVEINGAWYHLELADDPETRQLGLGGRDHIDADGGMIFVFKSPLVLYFVMRDCLAPIDIVFLDSSGRITAMHAMTIEDPEPEQKEGESDSAYNTRRAEYDRGLPKYSSRFAAQFALEFAGGTLDTLDLKPGDKIDLDTVKLKKLAR